MLNSHKGSSKVYSDIIRFFAETIHCAGKYLGTVVCSLDPAGAEALYSTRIFMPLLKHAGDMHIPLMIYEGEVNDPESLRDVLSLDVRRIGHGTFAAKYPDMIQEIIDEDVTLENCVTSNCQMKSILSLKTQISVIFSLQA